MKKIKPHGFSLVILLIIAVVIAGIVSITWYVSGARRQTAAPTQPPQQSDQSNQQSPADPQEGYVTIKEWGVRFKPIDGISDVLVFRPTNTPNDVDRFDFSTKPLAAREAKCNESGFSTILRTSEPLEAYERSLGKLGDYYFYYQGSSAACSQDASNFTFETEQRKVVEESVESLEMTH